jgi:menaquinone-dependent protoporphyrinogen oxidase
MHVLVVYGTTEGQTRKIAAFLAETLTRAGDVVTLVDVKELPPGFDLAGFDAVILAARVHAGTYPWSMTRFVRHHRAALETRPSAFVSVSMTAAGRTEADRQELDRYVENFTAKTSWRPRPVHHAAGARLYTKHGVVGRWILGLVDRHRFDPSRDHEFTDWEAVSRFAGEFRVAARSQIATSPGSDATFAAAPRGRPGDSAAVGADLAKAPARRELTF